MKLVVLAAVALAVDLRCSDSIVATPENLAAIVACPTLNGLTLDAGSPPDLGLLGRVKTLTLNNYTPAVWRAREQSDALKVRRAASLKLENVATKLAFTSLDVTESVVIRNCTTASVTGLCGGHLRSIRVENSPALRSLEIHRLTRVDEVAIINSGLVDFSGFLSKSLVVNRITIAGSPATVLVITAKEISDIVVLADNLRLEHVYFDGLTLPENQIVVNNCPHLQFIRQPTAVKVFGEGPEGLEILSQS